MGKFYGAVGFGVSIEGKFEDGTPNGIFVETITEHNYYGDVIRDQSRIRDGENLNSNLVIDNKFSIVGDPYSFDNFHAMRYVTWMGSKWKITSVEVQRPRLILSVGGVYNEQKGRTS